MNVGTKARLMLWKGTEYPEETVYVKRGGDPRASTPMAATSPPSVDQAINCLSSHDVIRRTNALLRLPRIALYRPWHSPRNCVHG